MRFDRYALFQIQRECRLSTAEYVVLQALTMIVDFRTHEWAGTLKELKDDVPPTIRTIRSAIDVLAGWGLIEIIEPFRINYHGRIRVTCYDRLVVADRPRGSPSRAQTRASSQSSVESESEPDRSSIALNGANDQEFHSGSWDRGDEVVDDEHVLPGERAAICPHCQKAITGDYGQLCQCPF